MAQKKVKAREADDPFGAAAENIQRSIIPFVPNQSDFCVVVAETVCRA